MRKIRYVKGFVWLIFIIIFSCAEALSDEELRLRFDKAVAKKNWTAAKQLIDEHIKRNPEVPELHLSRARIATNVSPLNLEEISNDLSIYIKDNPTDARAIMLRFQAYAQQGKFNEALLDIDEVIRQKGKNAFLLSWKGNCAFAAKQFDIAVKAYEQRLKMAGSYDDLRNNYYYMIFSKYLGGNKEGASWDCALLENRGFKEDSELMKFLSEGAIDHEKLALFQIPSMSFSQLEELLNNSCSTINLFSDNVYFNSPISRELILLEKTEDLSRLSQKKHEVYMLNLGYSNYKSLPKEIHQFINLQALNLSGNKFKDLEQLVSDLSKLPNLKMLLLNRCGIKQLPENIHLLSNVEILYLGTNGLRSLDGIGSLTRLKLLSVRGNSRLKELPQEIGELRCLQRLDISATGLTGLVEELSNCTQLISISANASKIKTLPQNIGNLINLKHLNLGANKIEELPISIGDMESLEHLSLGSNELKQLPKSISSLKSLDYISLNYNRFKEFPKELLSINSLYTLWLHNNTIPEIPTDVANMKKLEYLLVDHQIITEKNIKALEDINPNLRVIKEDSRKYVKGRKRK